MICRPEIRTQFFRYQLTNPISRIYCKIKSDMGIIDKKHYRRNNVYEVCCKKSKT